MINKETKIIINNKTYTVQEFMKKYAVQDESTALMIIDKLVAQGKATIKDESTKEEKLIQDTLKAIEKDAIVEGLDIEAEENRIAKRQKAKETLVKSTSAFAFSLLAILFSSASISRPSTIASFSIAFKVS